MINHAKFVTYIRTKQFFKQRLKGKDENPYTPVHISTAEIEERFFPYPRYKRKDELSKLKQAGEIEITIQDNCFMYRALKPGAIDISLLKRRVTNYGPYTLQIKESLQNVSLPNGAPSTPYFDLFVKHRKNYMDYFFTVDEFAGRIHTPVSGLNREYRANLLLEGQTTSSLDVAQMQPTLLGKILQAKIGENEFSSWIDQGKDIYVMLQEKAGLADRDDAKKHFFKIIFGKPDSLLKDTFGNANWIDWINTYKSYKQPQNTSDKVHSNLAWLLQSTEVQTMRSVWKLLVDEKIKFCSVHDEVIVKKIEVGDTLQLMRSALNGCFEYYLINIDGK